MNTLPARAKKNLGKARPIIQIELEGDEQEVYAPSYTTLDEIKGTVTITCQADLGFDDIYITFEGATKTYVEKIATASPTTSKSDGFHYFLRLVQPVDPEGFPESRILEAHKPYKLPFQFVVPERLLPQNCSHSKSPNLPEDAHLRLPPSLGDPALARTTLKDDMCPDMATIMYAIRCRLTSGQNGEGRHKTMIESAKKVCIFPAAEEAPPLKVDGGDKDDYILRREKGVKMGSLRKKIGRLAAEGVQPRSLALHSIHVTDPCPVTTMATINGQAFIFTNDAMSLANLGDSTIRPSFGRSTPAKAQHATSQIKDCNLLRQ